MTTYIEATFDIDTAIEIQEGLAILDEDLEIPLEQLLEEASVKVGGVQDECRKNFWFECKAENNCAWRGGAEGCRQIEDPSEERSNFSVVHALLLPLVAGMKLPPVPGGRDPDAVEEESGTKKHSKHSKHSKTKHRSSRSASKVLETIEAEVVSRPRSRSRTSTSRKPKSKTTTRSRGKSKTSRIPEPKKKRSRSRN